MGTAAAAATATALLAWFYVIIYFNILNKKTQFFCRIVRNSI
jgi:hypothetical protein